MLGLPKVEWGQFPTGFAGTKAWILPNPSGLNRVFTLDALVEAYSELRRQLDPRPAQLAQAKPNEVVQTPVATLSGRAASRATKCLRDLRV